MTDKTSADRLIITSEHGNISRTCGHHARLPDRVPTTWSPTVVSIPWMRRQIASRAAPPVAKDTHRDHIGFTRASRIHQEFCIRIGSYEPLRLFCVFFLTPSVPPTLSFFRPSSPRTTSSEQPARGSVETNQEISACSLNIELLSEIFCCRSDATQSDCDRNLGGFPGSFHNWMFTIVYG